MGCECKEKGGWCVKYQRQMTPRLVYLCQHSDQFRAVFDRQYEETKRQLEVPFPPIYRMVAAMFRSLWSWWLIGFKTCYRVQRMKICNTCPGRVGSRCRPCGCFLWLKTRMPHESCPIGSWGTAPIQDDDSLMNYGGMVQIKMPKGGCGCGK